MTMSPARSVVFGIARRVPPPNTSQKNLNTRIVSDHAKQVPHTTIERIIFPQILIFLPIGLVIYFVQKKKKGSVNTVAKKRRDDDEV